MVTRKAPGKFYRKGITLLEIVRQFDTPEKGENVVYRATLAERDSLSSLRKP